MAYMAFKDFDRAIAVQQSWYAAPAADLSPSGADRLTDLEWLVVAIARKDGRSTLRRPGWVTTALRILFGRSNPMLTDPRLEALRRMAVLTWRRSYSVASHEVRAFLAAGFTSGQYETLADHIGAARITPRNRDRLDGSEADGDPAVALGG